MDSLETEECSVVERPGTGVQTFFGDYIVSLDTSD